MLIDRIDWIDGWPRVRAGAGPSDSPQPAPVTGTDLGINSANPAAAGFIGLSAGPVDPQAGRTAELDGAARTRVQLNANRVRVRLDFDAERPVQVELGRRNSRVVVTFDPRSALLGYKAG